MHGKRLKELVIRMIVKLQEFYVTELNMLLGRQRGTLFKTI